MAFSQDTRLAIHKRANGLSELDYKNNVPMQCAHLTHNKSLPEYDTTDMGLLVTTIQEYAYHVIMNQSDSHRKALGLTKMQNQWSLEVLWATIQDWKIKNKPLMTNNELLDLVDQAKTEWFYHLGIEG